MIIERENDAVESSGLGTQQGFTIQANAEMFEMLSSGLYTDKIKAVIRETTTNANDSMIEAGTLDTMRAEVHLPTTLEPFYGIRDFGTGLSPTQITELYTSYGASSKRDSNLFNGALGVGSKSPFSYVSTFNIDSFYEGKKYSYSCYIDNGQPQIMHLNTATTEEHNGLYIEVTVKYGDINTFVARAEGLYPWFTFPPKTNITLSTFKIDEILVAEDQTWVLHNKVAYSDTHMLSNKAKVVMGNIVYPISTESFDYGSLEYTVANSPIIIYADIGDVRMSASREGLSMTPATVEWLTKKFKAITRTLSKTMQSNVDNISNVWDKYINFNKQVANLDSSLRKHISVTINGVEYRGNQAVKLEIFTTSTGFTVTKYNTRVKNGIKMTDGSNIIPHEDVVILLSDSKQGAITTAMSLRDSLKKTVYLIRVGRGEEATIESKFKGGLGKRLGGPTYKRVSDIYVAPAKRTREVRDTSFSLRQLSAYSRRAWMPYASLLHEARVFYVPLIAGNPASADWSSMLSDFNLQYVKDFLKILEGSETCPVYGINKSDKNKVKNNTNLINVIDYIKSQWSKLKVPLKSPYLKLGEMWTQDRLLRNVEIAQENLGTLPKNHLLLRAAKEFSKARKQPSVKEYDVDIISAMFGKKLKHSGINADEKVLGAIKNYPLADYVYNAPKEQLLEYIMLVDGSKA